MRNTMLNKISLWVLSGVWLALSLSQITLGAQEPKARNLESGLTPTSLTAQEAKITNPEVSPTARAFTYQGQLKDANGPVSGPHDFQFIMYSAQTGGARLGANEMLAMVLTNGMFSFRLDFGSVVTTAKDSWL